MQLSRRMRWAATGRIVPPSAAFDGGLTPTPRRRSLMRGNDISEEPITQRWNGRRVRAESTADWVCASTRGRLVSTPLNRGTVLTARLLSASLKRR
jgi:hypothetical protein